MDAETMEAIEKWAADEFRSTNGQLQWIIAEALRKSGRMKKKKTIIKKFRNTSAGNITKLKNKAINPLITSSL